jgi:hypothetical protein
MGGFLTPLIFAVSPNPTPVVTGVSTADVVYKHPLEIWLDTLRDEIRPGRFALTARARRALVGNAYARYLFRFQ